MAQTQDDAFHEIQLNGKQLVFLFMAATVVSVVIFLCGVLVGRNVKAERGGSESSVTSVEPPAPAPAPVASSEAGPAAKPDDKFEYPKLDQPSSKAESLKAERAAKAAPAPEPRPASPPAEAPKTSSPPVAAAAPAEKPAEKAPSPAVAEKPSTSGTSGLADPGGQGFAVQIAALNVRSEADAIAKRLSSKGYSAYVLAPASGTPAVFRVRVGKFSTRHEAETVAAKLQKEEQLKPWVTR